jgi:hypothetical protein
MTATIMTFPARQNFQPPQPVHIRKTIPATCLPAQGSSVLFYRARKLCSGTVIVVLPSGQIMVKPDNGDATGWITRRDLHTHFIFTPPPAPGAA